MGSIVLNLDELAYFIVVGASFLYAFNLKAKSTITDGFEVKIVKAILLGYFICFVAFNIPCTVNFFVDRIIIVAISFAIGLLSSTVIYCERTQIFLKRIKISKLPYNSIWDYVLSKEYGDHLIIKKNNEIIEGVLHKLEEKAGERWVSLKNYIIRDETGEVLKEDHSNDDSQIICLKIDSSDYVEIKYYTKDRKSEIGIFGKLKTSAKEKAPKEPKYSYRLLSQKEINETKTNP